MKKLLYFLILLLFILVSCFSIYLVSKSDNIDINISYNYEDNTTDNQTLDCKIKNNSNREIVICKLSKYNYGTFYIEDSVFDMPFEIFPNDEMCIKIPIKFSKRLTAKDKVLELNSIKLQFVLQMAYPEEQNQIKNIRNLMLDKICDEKVIVETTIC